MENQIRTSFEPGSDRIEKAKSLDLQDPLREFRQDFTFPQDAKTGAPQIYFTGHSLGLMPKNAKSYVNEEFEAWGKLAVEGHFKHANPWLSYHEVVTTSLARLVGARESEVVAMNSLTVNLHLMLVSFYRPTAKKFKILVENNTFPSDKYAVDSQVKWHGFDPKSAVVELKPRPGRLTVDPADVLEQIHALGDSLALVMLGNCNYLSGQCFDFAEITKAAHNVGALCGFNLAHGAGNLPMRLHDWNVDFAVWCSYKYLNAGPGGIAGAFVHSNHHSAEIPRFEGWWGHDKKSRFKMGPQFSAIPTVESWQLSNPPIFQLASLRASLEIFDRATMETISKKCLLLTDYFAYLLKSWVNDEVEIVTPLKSRGAMLCLRFKKSPREIANQLFQKSFVVDFREPDIIRAAPAPLYNSFEDVFKFVTALRDLLHEK